MVGTFARESGIYLRVFIGIRFEYYYPRSLVMELEYFVGKGGYGEREL